MIDQHVLDALQQGATLLTGSQRLARHLRHEFNDMQRRKGLCVWETPDILPWSAWLQRGWDLLSLEVRPGRPVQVLLNSQQEQVLWEHIVAESAHGQTLLQIPATARLARDAWYLSRAWRVTVRPDHIGLNEDARAFCDWSQEFARICSDRSWLDGAGLPDVIAQHMGDNTRGLECMLLAGFDELTPQQQELLDAIRASGTVVERIDGERRAGNVRVVGLPSALAEVTAAARWVRGLLEQGVSRRIGVVVPQLANLRSVVARVFDDILQPDSVLPTKGRPARPYNISLGQPLLDYPVVHAAFMILDGMHGSFPLSRLGTLLRSPFLKGADAELSPRCLLDSRLRRTGGLNVSIKTLLRYAQGADGAVVPYACPQLRTIFEGWLAAIVGLPERQSPSAWATSFSQHLAILGWPGGRPLTSDEYQAVQAWRELLANLSSLDAILPTLNLGQAVDHLRRLAVSTIFQPQSPDVPVQVLGMLEAAALEFDHVWVMGLHDEAWPEAPRPNPFLPIEKQRRRGLPHSSAERELQVARRITRRLMTSAPDVTASYPRAEGERDLRPSPLLTGETRMGENEIVVSGIPTYQKIIQQTATLETLRDNRAPPLPEASVAGGSGLFKKQAACPFWAFAEIRLGARPLDLVEPGLNAMERGTLVHRVLEYVWTELKSHQRLCESSPAELDALINNAVTRSIEEMSAKLPEAFTHEFSKLERERLRRLVGEWLQLDKQRVPFADVTSEQTQQISVGGIEVTTKIDRIDTLEDGQKVIIDYKTGTPSPSQWLGDRPDEPQLPLYTLAMNGEVAAVLFAQLKVGELSYKGVCRTEDIVPGIKPFRETRQAGELGSWEALMSHWQDVLTRLAEDFRAGQAQVDPKDYPGTCKYCSLTALCRINEITSLGLTEAGEEISGD